MTNYGKSDILGSATVLPATFGTGLLLLSTAHPLIIGGLLLVMLLNFIVLLGSVSRFVINRRRFRKYENN